MINEFKGWPVVDGKAEDAGKVGDTIRQMGIYRHLLMTMVDRLGGDLGIVASDGLLITPRNVGLTLTATPVSIERATVVATTTLAAVPDPAGLAPEIAPDLSFGTVGDQKAPEEVRIAAVEALAEAFGTRYQEGCLSNCGMARYCRGNAHRDGSPSLCGTTTVRFLPGVRTLSRAAELADGAAPDADEALTGAPDRLAAAGDLYHRHLAEAGLAAVAG